MKILAREGQDEGFVDSLRSMVLFAPNLAWRETPLRAALEQRFGSAGYTFTSLGTRPSIYQRAPIYAALMEGR